MNLHYSQTKNKVLYLIYCFTTLWIYTILKHGRQKAVQRTGFTTLWIYTILKTAGRTPGASGSFTTLWIYTILKLHILVFINHKVLLPYEFTLFSNHLIVSLIVSNVLLPYEFTLFSNNKSNRVVGWVSFTTLWIYTILKRHQLFFISIICFTTLWIYTILKPFDRLLRHKQRFTTLWIYTILKLSLPLNGFITVLLPYEFTLFSNRKLYFQNYWMVLLPYEFTLFSN